MKNRFLYIVTAIFLLTLFIFIENQSKQTPPPSTVPISPLPASSSILGVQTKSSHCIAEGPIPDKACTPGAVFPEITREQICVKGYSKSVRNVPENEKKAVYEEYGIPSHVPGEYEVDHYISLELGGSNDIANLWPEPAEPKPGFHEKDIVENYLHDQVCKGIITLQQAQQEIADNWTKVYDRLRNAK